MPKDLVLVLKWVKSVLRCVLYIFHLFGVGIVTQCDQMLK